MPSDGNCSGTGAHLDPSNAGANSATPATYKCNPANPATCEVGDLAGKHGNINSTIQGNAYSAQYLDTFLSTTPGNAAFFGDLSIVVHRQIDSARLNCGNFTLVGSSTGTNSTTTMQSTPPYGNNTTTVIATAPPPTVTYGSSPTSAGSASVSSSTSTNPSLGSASCSMSFKLLMGIICLNAIATLAI